MPTQTELLTYWASYRQDCMNYLNAKSYAISPNILYTLSEQINMCTATIGFISRVR